MKSLCFSSFGYDWTVTKGKCLCSLLKPWNQKQSGSLAEEMFCSSPAAGDFWLLRGGW